MSFIYNGHMLGENKNLKDPMFNQSVDLRDRRFSISYSKTNKLITALYMVTDVLEEDEPIRGQLRTLGVNVITDISNISWTNYIPNSSFSLNFPSQINKKLYEILSLLEVAYSMGMISSMNFNILKDEFILLKEAIDAINLNKNSKNIIDLLKEEDVLLNDVFKEKDNVFKGQSIGQAKTRIGVQKGNTLMKALSDKFKPSPLENKEYKDKSFNVLKDKRREKIISIIKDKKYRDPNFNGLSIKDIDLALKVLGEEWGNKTLQRELSALVADGILSKKGEKRWSRYSLN